MSAALILGWRRYEKARKLSPRQWSDLHARNLGGESFDEMIDALPDPSTPEPTPAAGLNYDRIYEIVRGTGYVTRGQADEITELLIAAGIGIQPEVAAQLHLFLDAAGGEGISLAGIDGGDLYVSMYGHEPPPPKL